MRDYGKIHSTFWTSKTIRALSDDGKTLALYLMTSQHTTIAGVFRLPDGYASDDLQWTFERVSKGFAELFDKGFANRCETTFWVWINKHLDWNAPENPNQWKAASKVAALIPDDCAWRSDFIDKFGDKLCIKPKPLRKGSKTVSKPETGTGTETETGTENKKPSSPAGDGLPDGFAEFWQAFPRKASKPHAISAWRKLKLDTKALPAILAGLERDRRSAQWLRDDGQYIPHPATWLNGKRWEDEQSGDRSHAGNSDGELPDGRVVVDGVAYDASVGWTVLASKRERAAA